MAWLSLYAYVAALIAAVFFYNRIQFRPFRLRNGEYGGIALALLVVWGVITLDYYVGAAGDSHLISTILVQIACGVWVGYHYKNGVSGVVTLLFIPMVLVNLLQYVTAFLDPWEYFYVMSLLSWAQIVAYFTGARFDGVGRFFDRYTRSSRLFDIMATRYRGNQ